MVIVFNNEKDYNSGNVIRNKVSNMLPETGNGLIESFTSILPVIKSAAEAVVPIATTAKIIKETINLPKSKKTINLPKPKDKNNIFQEIRENLAKKKNGAGFVKID